MRRQNFTQRWFFNNAAEFTRTMRTLRGKPLRYLEVGVFEGASALWMFENVLTHPSSCAVLVDWWSPEHWGRSWKSPEDVEATARLNMAPYADRCKILKGPSCAVLAGYSGGRFDVAYIDGSHEASDVLADSRSVWKLVVPGGLVLWDDYRWKIHGNKYRPPTPTQKAIDSFLETIPGAYETLASATQLHVRKH